MNVNKSHYDLIYSNLIDYKFKTNTRYQRYLVKCILEEIDTNEILSLCDVGCGLGLNTALFVNDFPNADILGIDISSKGIDFANNYYQNTKRLSFKCADITEFHIENSKFDIITAFELLEHIEDWEKVAEAITNSAKKYIILSAPVGRMRTYEVNHGHFRNFKKGQLEEWFEAHGFIAVKTFYAGFPFWSPITRDLLNLLPGWSCNSTKIQSNLSFFGKIISLALYYSYRYLSTKQKYGDQFVGLFKKC